VRKPVIASEEMVERPIRTALSTRCAASLADMQCGIGRWRREGALPAATRALQIFRRSFLQTQPPKRGFGFNAARAWDLGYPCAIHARGFLFIPQRREPRPSDLKGGSREARRRHCPGRKGSGHYLDTLTYTDMTPGRTLRVSLAGRGALLSQGWLSRD
jgi:hypothetical protein